MNHQAFSFNGNKVQRISHLFNSIAQSGFNFDQIPSEWIVIPTCQIKGQSETNKNTRAAGAIYLGTVSYKKADMNFFLLIKGSPSL